MSALAPRAFALSSATSAKSARNSRANPSSAIAVSARRSLSARSAHVHSARALNKPSAAVSRTQQRSLSMSVSAASMADFTADRIDGKSTKLSSFVGKNYKELVTVYNKYKSQGFEVLAFPCNQFGGQEPGSNMEIKKFAEGYGAKFPMFAKIDVNGPNTHPFYKYLKDTHGSFPTSDIKWNFGKFLVDKEGKAIKRYAPTDSPMSIVKDIEANL